MDEEMKRLVDRWVAVFLEMPVLLDAGLMRPMLAEAERRLAEDAEAREPEMVTARRTLSGVGQCEY